MTYKLPEKKTTPYQEWLNPALKRAGKSLKWLYITVDMDYTSLWKIARGNPDVYPGSSRPDHANAVKIGEALGDVEGSLHAAGYATPDSIDMVILRKIQSLNDTDKEQMERLIDRLVRDSLQ